MVGPGSHTSQEQRQAWNLLQAGCLSPLPHPTCINRGQSEQKTLPTCSVPRTPDLPTLPQHSVHVPLWCQSPRAWLEFRTHDAGWCVDFWTYLLSVKQTDLDTKNKSRLINHQKSHNSPQENLHVHFMWMCSIAWKLTTHPLLQKGHISLNHARSLRNYKIKWLLELISFS